MQQPLAYIPSPSRGLVHLGPLPLRGYALMIILGVVAAVWLGERRWAARGGTAGTVVDIAVWAVPFGLVGGRLYHVITDYQLYFGKEWHVARVFEVWKGGLGIWGAIAAGALGAYLGCRRRGVSLRTFADAAAPGIALAQALGRWGNWFNQELYGRPTKLPWAVKIDPAHRVNTPDIGTYHPTFLYESLWCIGVAVLVIWAEKRFRLAYGRTFALYVAAYTVGRAWIEWLRVDSAHHILGLRLNDWTSLIVFLGAVAYLYYYRDRTEIPEGAVGPAVTEPGTDESPASAEKPTGTPEGSAAKEEPADTAGDDPAKAPDTSTTADEPDSAEEPVGAKDSVAADKPAGTAAEPADTAGKSDAETADAAEPTDQPNTSEAPAAAQGPASADEPTTTSEESGASDEPVVAKKPARTRKPARPRRSAAAKKSAAAEEAAGTAPESGAETVDASATVDTSKTPGTGPETPGDAAAEATGSAASEPAATEPTASGSTASEASASEATEAEGTAPVAEANGHGASAEPADANGHAASAESDEAADVDGSGKRDEAAETGESGAAGQGKDGGRATASTGAEPGERKS